MNVLLAISVLRPEADEKHTQLEGPGTEPPPRHQRRLGKTLIEGVGNYLIAAGPRLGNFVIVSKVRWNGKPYGLACPQQVRRHSHPKAKPETPATAPPATGIDYLGIIAAEHAAAQQRRINYGALPGAAPGEPRPADGQEQP